MEISYKKEERMNKPLASSPKTVVLSEVSVNESEMDANSASALLSANSESEKNRDMGVWSSVGMWGFEFET